ncbi:MAG: minor capsid protein [Candidatus Spyradocola sp.]|jgi:SPP1 gp7 family putative phage head morphogenesis protein
MSSTAEYWAERSRAVMEQGMEKAGAVAAELEKSYRRAQREVQAAVDKICATFAGESGLSYADAMEYLTRGELKEWHYTLAEYVERINAAGDKELLRELNALSARSRIRRLQQVQTAIDVAASELASRGESLVQNLLEDVYGGTFDATGGALRQGLGVRLEMLNRAQVAQAVAYPWSGASFSERIWNNADNLARALKQTVTQGLIQGQDVRQMRAAIAKATGASASDAERLIRTETARCVEEASLAGYRAAGVGRYQILVDVDERTCKLCGAIDEEAVHEVAGAVTGVNLPPFHPRCRCTTVPYFSEEELARWEKLGAAASGEPLANAGEDGILEERARPLARHPLPRLDEAVIPLPKFTRYALDAENEPDKARAFERALGYTAENAQALIDNIRRHLPEFEAVEKPDNGFGQRYQVILQLTGPNGKTANLLTAWVNDRKTGEMRLTSAYITKKKVRSSED